MKIVFYDSDKQPSTTPKRKLRHRNRDSGFQLNWIQAFGWVQNPFDQSLINDSALEKEKTLLTHFFVKQQRLASIRGGVGSGKTTLLDWLETELKTYKDFKIIRVAKTKTVQEVITQLAKPYQGLFGKRDDLSTEELEELFLQAKKQPVLLFDDLHVYPKEIESAIEIIAEKSAVVVYSSVKEHAVLETEADLQLNITKRDQQQYSNVLSSRIKESGGAGIHPFTQEDIGELAQNSACIADFLSQAEQRAIEYALGKREHEKKDTGKAKEFDDIIASLEDGL